MKREDIYKQKLNNILELNNQFIRVEFYSLSFIKLNNGLIIDDKKEISLFKNRLTRGKDILSIIDSIYKPHGIDYNVIDDLKHNIRVDAGLKCQSKHPDTFKNNLHGRIPWNRGCKGLQTAWNKGKNKNNNEGVKRISESKMGDKNPMYGKKHSNDRKSHLSRIMKQKIENGEFTPNIHNSLTHKQIIYNNKRYRSSWEVIWHYLHPHHLYEKLRIPYYMDGKKHIYIVDFVDEINKICIEIKPSSMHSNKKDKLKWSSLEKWCSDNEYDMMIIDESFIYSRWGDIDLSIFDKNVKVNVEKCYETYIKKNNL